MFTDTRQLLSDAKFFEGYSRFIEEKEHYESWNDAVDRVMAMHREYYKDKLGPELEAALDFSSQAYKEKGVLGAQRALQFGGDQLLKHQMKMYNCTSTYIDRPEVFGELFYIGLCGCGAGFSVQQHHIAKLPQIMQRTKAPKIHTVEDSIEGWADALDALMASYFEESPKFSEYRGHRVYFDLSKIRPKGAKISGGFKAPGPDSLRLALDRIEHILQGVTLSKKKAKLRAIQAYDIIMHAMDAVIAGGVRRSATICIFSPEDEEMMTSKTGSWYIDNPQRARSNNSALVVRNSITKEQFDGMFENIKQFGEPGFIFADDTETMYNPCFTGDTIIAIADGRNGVSLKQLVDENKAFPVYSAIPNKKGKWKAEIKNAIAFKTGTRKVITVKLSNGDTFRCTPEHKLAIPGGNYIAAKDSKGMQLAEFFTTNEKYRTINSISNGFARQYRMIWEFYNGQKPKGYEIDHIYNNGLDCISNLQLLKYEDHCAKSAKEKNGFNNSVHKITNIKKWKNNLSVATFLENNPKFSGITNEELILNGKMLLENGKNITFPNLKKIDSRTPMYFSKNRFDGKIGNLIDICKGLLQYNINKPQRTESKKTQQENYDMFVVDIIDNNEVEDVYDLKVEDNNNFYIITSGDENFDVSRGVLVHNCAEIGMYPQLDGETGFQGCNLCEINGSQCDTPERFYDLCKAAAILGTLQAGYTDFKFLPAVSKKIFDREALIGVSITGWMSNPDILFDKSILEKGAKIVLEVNKKLAKLLGINPAARTTCVKPSGNSSVLLKTPSGIHPEHAPMYLRNIQINKENEVAGLFLKHNPHMIEESGWSASAADYVISFPIVAKTGSLYKSEINGISHLELVKMAQQHWVEAGTDIKLCVNKNVRHNVSNTISVKEHDWDSVRDYVFNNRKYFAGISFISDRGDKDYYQAPNTKVEKAETIVNIYGTGAVFASGLIVDGEKVFDNLWLACSTARGLGESLNIEEEQTSLKRDWVRRFEKYAANYFDGNLIKAEYCLKDVFNLHKWCKIQQTFNEIDWVSELKEKKFTDIDTTGGAACNIDIKSGESSCFI